MKEPSEARKRTLALQERAITFSVAVNDCCPVNLNHVPSLIVWTQLVKAADSSSNNLVEAEAASSDADFISKMRIALREAKESRTCLRKLRLGRLANAAATIEKNLEQEADELSAIFATIVINVEKRLAGESEPRRRKKLKARKRASKKRSPKTSN
jgi:four helix bundle protein